MDSLVIVLLVVLLLNTINDGCDGLTFLKPRKQNSTTINPSTSSTTATSSSSSSIPSDVSTLLKNNVINNNAVGGTKKSVCKILYTDSNNLVTSTSNTINDDTILVNIIYPDTNEINDYNKIPDTLTKANEAFGGLNPNRTYKLTEVQFYQYELRNEAVYWATIEGHSWQLPKTHPRNNKTICLLTSQQAG